jgi:hypothetical protein
MGISPKNYQNQKLVNMHVDNCESVNTHSHSKIPTSTLFTQSGIVDKLVKH